MPLEPWPDVPESPGRAAYWQSLTVDEKVDALVNWLLATIPIFEAVEAVRDTLTRRPPELLWDAESEQAITDLIDVFDCFELCRRNFRD